MLDRLITMVRAGAARDESVDGPDRALQLAVAALLVEAALMDGRFESTERDTIRRLVIERLDVPAGDADALIEDAEHAVDESGELWGFAKVVKDSYDEAARIGMIEMLWEVAYADGVLDAFEANLLRRIAGLIYVPDRESGEARKRVLARLGIDD